MLFGKMFIVGLALAAPVGAMAVLCMERTLAHGRSAGLSTGAGIASADATYAAVATLGIGALTQAILGARDIIGVVGGLVLIAIGVRAALRKGRTPSGAGSDQVRPGTPVAMYSSAYVLTLSNPATIVTFAAILAAAGIGEAADPETALVAVLGVAAGSFAWWCGLVAAVAFAGKMMTPALRVRLSRVSGMLVAVLGAAAVVSGVRGL